MGLPKVFDAALVGVPRNILDRAALGEGDLVGHDIFQGLDLPLLIVVTPYLSIEG